ncbi:MAG: hypothetical protein FJ151_00470 [Euryarchaeota archaeon]|nr:hypothetical protein [Euryarchaeota archaeon]
MNGQVVLIRTGSAALLGVAGILSLVWGGEGLPVLVSVFIFALFCAASASLYARRTDFYTLFAGALVLAGVFLIDLPSPDSVLGTWAVFGTGLLSILLGIRGTRLSSIVSAGGGSTGESSRLLSRAVRKSVGHTLVFFAAFMLVSVALLILSSFADLGSFSMILLAGCVLAAMFSLALLVSPRLWSVRPK